MQKPQKPQKPHWVSKFLTEPWEINEYGDLEYYDFARKAFGRPTPSARLFREKRRRSPALEHRINQLLETPLASAREDLGSEGQVSIKRWEIYRSIVLCLFLQATRTQAMVSRNDQVLNRLLQLPDDQINLITLVVMKGRQLVRLGSRNPLHALAYSDGGMFSFITRDRKCLTGWSWGLAIPLSPKIAFAWLSESADLEWLFEQCRSTAFLAGFSISGPKASRVVIAPEIALASTRPDLRANLSAEILRYKREMDHYRTHFQELRANHLRSLMKEGVNPVVVDDVTQRYGLTEEARTLEQQVEDFLHAQR